MITKNRFVFVSQGDDSFFQMNIIIYSVTFEDDEDSNLAAKVKS
mgnify:CR=1 FL=1